MDIRKISPGLSVAPQLTVQDIGALAGKGFRGIINNRPDGEDDNQPSSAEIENTARALGLAYRHIPVTPGSIEETNIGTFAAALAEMQGPVVAYCRTGTRATSLWALTEAGHLSTDAILETAAQAGYELDGLAQRLEGRATTFFKQKNGAASDTSPTKNATHQTTHDIVVVGGGAGGLAVVASLLKRRPNLDIVVIEPRDIHYYQPG